MEAVAVCVFVTTIVVLKVSVAVACGTSVSLSVIVVVVTETTVLPGIVVEMVSAVCVTVEVGATLIVVVPIHMLSAAVRLRIPEIERTYTGLLLGTAHPRPEHQIVVLAWPCTY